MYNVVLAQRLGVQDARGGASAVAGSTCRKDMYIEVWVKKKKMFSMFRPQNRRQWEPKSLLSHRRPPLHRPWFNRIFRPDCTTASIYMLKLPQWHAYIFMYNVCELVLVNLCTLFVSLSLSVRQSASHGCSVHGSEKPNNTQRRRLPATIILNEYRDYCLPLYYMFTV